MRRALAEWEEQDFLLLALPHFKTDWRDCLAEIRGAYFELMSAVAPRQRILALAPSFEDFAPFAGIKNVEFWPCDSDDTWARDYAPLSVLEKGRLRLLDFIFNAWGNKYKSAKDNALGPKLAAKLGLPAQSLPLVLEGGSVDFNGQGLMLTTEGCLLNSNRNPHLTKAQIEAALIELFGLKKIIWLKNGGLAGDDTDGHVDNLARFISPDTVAFCACEDEGDEHFEPLRKMREELEQSGLKLLPLPLPSPVFAPDELCAAGALSALDCPAPASTGSPRRLPASYVNFIFINGALILPVYDDEMDELVTARLASALPGRDLIPVRARAFIRQGGSLHCASKNFFKGQR